MTWVRVNVCSISASTVASGASTAPRLDGPPVLDGHSRRLYVLISDDRCFLLEFLHVSTPFLRLLENDTGFFRQPQARAGLEA